MDFTNASGEQHAKTLEKIDISNAQLFDIVEKDKIERNADDILEKINNKKIPPWALYSQMGIFLNETLQSKAYSSELKRRHGIYFIYNIHKEIIYIGKSNNLRNRIRQSVPNQAGFYYSYWLVEKLEDIDILEICLISLLNPPLNRIKIKLKDKFAKDISKEINVYFKSDPIKIFALNYEKIRGYVLKESQFYRDGRYKEQGYY